MSRYIDADKMLEICTKYVASVFPNSYEFAKQDAELLVAIEEAEHRTIDIVRCKECVYWSGCKSTMHNNHRCGRAENVDYWTRADDFCSYGERSSE